MKKLQDEVVMLSSVSGIFYRITREEANRFMMGDSISDVVNSCELVKYKPLIILHGGSAPGFGWQNIKQHSTTSCELPGSKHIPPETKTQFSNQFTVSVRVVQLLDCIVDSGFSHPALRVIENTTRSSGIT